MRLAPEWHGLRCTTTSTDNTWAMLHLCSMLDRSPQLQIDLSLIATARRSFCEEMAVIRISHELGMDYFGTD